MLRLHKGIFHALFLIVLCLISAMIAQADTFTATLPNFNGSFVPPNQTFPRPTLTIGAFNFTIPAGQPIIGATLTGTFGNSTNGTSAPLDLLIDGLQAAQCAPNAPCTGAFGTSGPTLFTFAFSAAQLSLLNDGAASLSFSQLGPGAARLSSLTLNVQTPVPEPATLLLLGTGLAGAAASARKRRHARRQN